MHQHTRRLAIILFMTGIISVPYWFGPIESASSDQKSKSTQSKTQTKSPTSAGSKSLPENQLKGRNPRRQSSVGGAVSGGVAGKPSTQAVDTSNVPTPAIPVGQSGEMIGVPWTGAAGIIETTEQMMIRERQAQLLPKKPRPLRKELEHERDKDLPQNPDAPAVSQWPPVNENDVSQRPGQPGLTVQPLAPQTTSTSFTGATLADTGAFPPDTMGAVGPTQYCVAINGRFRTFNKTTGVADGNLDISPDVFFASVLTTPSAGGVNFTTDPQIRFDRLSDRWFLVMLDVPLNSSFQTDKPNRILLAVSNTATITSSTAWTLYQFQGDATLFTDYESLGIDANALYIGGDMFALDTAGGAFNSTKGFVVRKAEMLTASPLVVTAFPNLAVGTGAGPFAPRGADNYDPTNTGPTATGYFVGVDNATFSTLMFRRVTNPAGTTPTISANISVTVPTTSSSAGVPQSGGTTLDSLDDRLYAAHIRNGRLWTAHNLRVNTSGVASTATGNRHGVRWYEFQNLGTTPTLVQSGTQFDNTVTNPRHHFIPSIMVSGQGHAAMGCSVSGSTQFAGAFTNGRLVTDTLNTLQAGVVYQAGAANYNPADGSNPHRWGDYSYTSLDPCDDMTMWTIQEFCDATNSYGVRVVKLLAPVPTVTACGTATDVPQGTTNMNIVVTGTGFYDPPATGISACRVPISASVSGTGVTVNSTTFSSPTSVTINISVSGAATTGLRNIVITNPDGQSSTGSNGCINITGVPTPNVIAAGSSITAGACGSPVTSAIDPGETVTVDFSLQNNGAANTTNLVATLQASGGVTPITTSQNYGVLVASGAAVTRSFQFTASGACGSTITATFQLQDGALNLGTATFNFTLGGSAQVIFSQDFEGATVPALPAGWTSPVTGIGTAWGTTSTNPDAGTKTAFVNGVTNIGSSSLTSPSIAIPAGATGLSLTFRQARNLESTFDGGVLELSTNGGANFNDVTSGAVGGSFAVGGYNGTIDSGFSSPIAGRQAWTGVQATYITSTVNLPATLAGQNIILRWQGAWDSSTANANPNWRVDTISLSGIICSSCVVCPTLTGTVTGGGTICAGGSSTVTVTVTGGGTPPYTVTLNNGGGTQTGSSPLTFMVSPSSTTTYSVMSGSDSATCPITGSGSATVTVNQPPTTATVGSSQTICANGTTTDLGGNTPSSGTGQWSIDSGGTGTFNPNATTPNATFTHTGGTGPVIVRWTISNSPCTASSATVTITITQAPTTATVGGPQTICVNGTTTGLGGNTPTVGTGTWSIDSGGTGTFNPNATTPNATFTHTGGAGPVTVRWTISNSPCTASSATVVITINQPPTTAAVGGPQTICANGTTNGLGGNTPASGTGTWSVVGGGTGTFNPNATTPNATFTHTGGAGPVMVRWTISSSPCTPDSTADVTITITQAPTTATVGGPQTICASGTTVGLGGNTPVVGSGSWSVVGGGTGTFNPNAATPNAAFTHTGGTGSVMVQWTISNGSCTASSATVNITITQPPTTATVGGPQTICTNGATTGLGGNTPSSGTGTWSVVGGGTGTFNPNATTPNATFTHTGGAGPVMVRWTISNSPCTPNSTADVIITISPAATVNAGPDQTICAGLNVVLAGSRGGSSSSATWSGGGGTFAPNATTLNAFYTPSPAEVIAGFVTLTLTTDDPTGGCAAVSDTVTINFINCNLQYALMVADTSNNRVQGFDGTNWAVIGVGTVGSGNGQFRLPEAVTFSFDGQRIYVADTGNNRIQWSTDAGVTWADFATNGTATNQVKAPQGLALDTNGNLYVSDTGNGRVMRFNGGVPGFGTVIASNGAASGQVGSPRGLAVDSTFRLFVTDETNSRILRINNANTVVAATSGTVIATAGTGMNKVQNPQGITIDSNGTIFVADTGNSRILRWINANPANATALALVGSQLGQVNRPEGVTVTQFATGPFAGGPFLVVGDTSNNRIQGRFIPTGQWNLVGSPNNIGSGVGQFRAPSKIQ
ncbi:MAG: hypothetical protein HY774_06515 [Acidobacteria bacterium]|nr:hypothetical protein [Acidobacteriota bacterium]